MTTALLPLYDLYQYQIFTPNYPER